MEVKPAQSKPVASARRSLGEDVVRALVALAVALATGIPVASVTGTLSPIYVIWTATVAPAIFLALILGYGSRDRSVLVARLSGALLGWTLLLGLFWFWNPGSGWLFSFRTYVVVVGPLLAVGFVAAGQIAGEMVLRMTRKVPSDVRGG